MLKYLGKPGKAKAAATDTPDSTPNATAAATTTPAQDSAQLAAKLAKLEEYMKQQGKTIEALKSSF